VGRGVEVAAGLLGNLGGGGERVDAAGEADLALVDVADAGGDALVHQHGADLGTRFGQRGVAGQDRVEVDLRFAEVRAQAGQGRG
jgi:hypothetical protein